MESANLRLQHQLQDQYVGYSSLASQSGYKVSSTHGCWNPSNILNIGSTYNMYLSDGIPKSSEIWPPPIETSMRQGSFTQQSAKQLLLANIEEEMSDSFPKLSEMIHSPSNIEESHLLSTMNHYPQCSLDVGDQNLWLSNCSSGHPVTELQLWAGEWYPNNQQSTSMGSVAASTRNDFSNNFPHTIISSSDLSSSVISSSLALKLQALDLLSPSYDGGSSSQSSHTSLLSRESMFLGHDHMQELRHIPSNSSNKRAAFVNGVARTKRPARFSESKESHAEDKKYGSSCPPLKVRKEKLGDRIAALQKLVSPFGKADTASVLTEAIGYIKFLHDQIETLSTPYMKSSHGKRCRTLQVGSQEAGKEEPKQDLRRRGLCLVPVSRASYFSNSNGGMWTIP